MSIPDEDDWRGFFKLLIPNAVANTFSIGILAFCPVLWLRLIAFFWVVASLTLGNVVPLVLLRAQASEEKN